MKIRDGLNLALFIAVISSLSAFSRAASIWTVLDDFSSSAAVTNYTAYDSDTATGRDVVYGLDSGQLKPINTIIRAGYAGGFWWDRGEVLKPGDSVKVDFRVGTQNVCSGFRFSKTPFGKALTASDTTSSGTGTIVHGTGTVYTNTCWVNVYQRIGETKFQLTAGSGGTGQGSAVTNGIWLASGDQPTTNDFITLVVTRGEGANQNVLSWSFAGDYLVGNRGMVTMPNVDATNGLYFAMNMNGSSDRSRFDNLSYATWVVLDDFSNANAATNYMAYDADIAAGRDVVYGLSTNHLKPINTIVRGGYACGFWWTGGDMLTPGDSVKVDFRVGAQNVCNGFRFSKTPFGKALTLADKTSSGSGTITQGVGTVYADTCWVNVYLPAGETQFQLTAGTGGTGSGGVDDNGVALIAGAQATTTNSFITLVVTRGEEANQNVLTWSFEGAYFVGNSGTVTMPNVDATNGLYFAMNMNGSSDGGRFDNLALRKNIPWTYAFPTIDSPPWWTNRTHRVILGVPPSSMADARTVDERPAILEIDLTNELAAAGFPGKKPDLTTLILVEFDPDASGATILYTNNAVQVTPADRPVCWYDAAIPFSFPDFSEYIGSMNGAFTYDYLDLWGYFYGDIGKGEKGRLAWVHTQRDGEPTYYAAYFNITNSTAAPTGAPPRHMIGDGNHRTEVYGATSTGLLQTRIALDDWNCDGKVDIIVGSSRGQIHWWPNLGTAQTPKFAYSYMVFKDDGYPLDVGRHGSPLVVDWDGDGDKDLIVSSLYRGNLNFFKNTGSNTNRVFSYYGFLKTNETGIIESPWEPNPETCSTSGVQSITQDYYSQPIAVDWDQDGDLDLLAGGYVTGQIMWYKNTGISTSGLPVLTNAGFITLSNGSPLDVGWCASPTVADLNGDGKLDLISGLMAKPGLDGTIYQPGEVFLRYFEGVGSSATNPKLELKTLPKGGTFPSVSLATPVLWDFDADSDLDLIVSAGMNIYFITNTGTSTSPNFAAGNTSLLVVQNGSTPLPLRGQFQDLNNDGHPDIVDGTTYDTNTGEGYPFRFAATQSFLPSGTVIDHPVEQGDGWQFHFVTDLDNDSKRDILFGDFWGQVWFHKCTSDVNNILTVDTNGVRIVDTNGVPIHVPGWLNSTSTWDFATMQGSRIMFTCDNFVGSSLKDIITRDTDGKVTLFEQVTSTNPGIIKVKSGVEICDVAARGTVYNTDWDGDGRMDVYLPGSENYDTILLNGTNGWNDMLFTRPGIPVAGAAISAQPVDMNNDGDDDILVTNGEGYTSLMEKTFLGHGYAQGQILAVEQKP